MFSILRSMWVLPQISPRHPELIVPLDYAMDLSLGLAKPTMGGFCGALELACHYPDAALAFGNSSHCYPGSEKDEARFKDMLLQESGIANRVIDAGGITNTVTEARKIRDALPRDFFPKEILVITGPLHSRSAYLVWQRTFPSCRISLLYFGVDECQENHFFPLQRSGWRWLAANVLRQLALLVLGLDRVARIQHKP